MNAPNAPAFTGVTDENIIISSAGESLEKAQLIELNAFLKANPQKSVMFSDNRTISSLCNSLRAVAADKVAAHLKGKLTEKKVVTERSTLNLSLSRATSVANTAAYVKTIYKEALKRFAFLGEKDSPTFFDVGTHYRLQSIGDVVSATGIGMLVGMELEPLVRYVNYVNERLAKKELPIQLYILETNAQKARGTGDTAEIRVSTLVNTFRPLPNASGGSGHVVFLKAASHRISHNLSNDKKTVAFEERENILEAVISKYYSPTNNEKFKALYGDVGRFNPNANGVTALTTSITGSSFYVPAMATEFESALNIISSLARRFVT